MNHASFLKVDDGNCCHDDDCTVGNWQKVRVPFAVLNVLPRKWNVPNCFATIETAILELTTVRSVRLRGGFGVIDCWLSLTEGARV